MPKAKRTQRQVEYERLTANIRYYMWRSDLTMEDVAAGLQVSERTVQRWIQDVSKITWADLVSLSMIFHCPVSDLTGGEVTCETRKRIIA